MLISVKVTFQVRMYCSCKKLLVTCLVMLGKGFKQFLTFTGIHLMSTVHGQYVKSIPVLNDLKSIPEVFWPGLVYTLAQTYFVLLSFCRGERLQETRKVNTPLSTYNIYYNGVGKCKYITKSLKYIKLKHNNAFRNITKAQHTPPEHFLCERFWKLNIWSIGQLNGKSLNCQRSFQFQL